MSILRAGRYIISFIHERSFFFNVTFLFSSSVSRQKDRFCPGRHQASTETTTNGPGRLLSSEHLVHADPAAGSRALSWNRCRLSNNRAGRQRTLKDRSGHIHAAVLVPTTALMSTRTSDACGVFSSQQFGWGGVMDRLNTRNGLI